MLPYAGISRQVKRSGLTFFNLFSSLANTYHTYSIKKDIPKTENVLKIRYCILKLPALVLANRFKGSGFNLLNYEVVPLLIEYYNLARPESQVYAFRTQISPPFQGFWGMVTVRYTPDAFFIRLYSAITTETP